ncbi:hypothetical protein [Nocardia sp. IFM 10818]
MSTPVGGVIDGSGGGSNRVAAFAFRTLTHVNLPAAVVVTHYMLDFLHVQLQVPGEAWVIPSFVAWAGIALGIRATRSGAAALRLAKAKLRVLRHQLRVLGQNIARGGATSPASRVRSR